MASDTVRTVFGSFSPSVLCRMNKWGGVCGGDGKQGDGLKVLQCPGRGMGMNLALSGEERGVTYGGVASLLWS